MEVSGDPMWSCLISGDSNLLSNCSEEQQLSFETIKMQQFESLQDNYLEELRLDWKINRSGEEDTALGQEILNAFQGSASTQVASDTPPPPVAPERISSPNSSETISQFLLSQPQNVLSMQQLVCVLSETIWEGYSFAGASQSQLNSKGKKIKRNTRIRAVWACHLCDKTFGTSQHFRYHIYTHTKERPYKCDLCGKEFTQPGNLSRHRKLHSGEKPFACLQCPKQFARKDSLKRHGKTQRRHTVGFVDL